MKYFLTIVIVLAALIAGIVMFSWSGIYNIAATEPHWGITYEFIEMLRDRSIEVRSDDIQAPDLDDAVLRKTGFSHYHKMCRLCHGAPGYHSEEFAEGFYPSAPSMASGEIQEELGDAEIYWIAKNGIKLTGMPAFGPTHNDKELWGLVAIVKEIPSMSIEDYQRWVEAAAMGEDNQHEHGHEMMVETPMHADNHDEDSGRGETDEAGVDYHQ